MKKNCKEIVKYVVLKEEDVEHKDTVWNNTYTLHHMDVLFICKDGTGVKIRTTEDAGNLKYYKVLKVWNTKSRRLPRRVKDAETRLVCSPMSYYRYRVRPERMWPYVPVDEAEVFAHMI